MTIRLLKFSTMMVLTAALFVPSASAESDRARFQKGVKLFHAKQYKKAIHAFGAALNSEFNNAKLHYYLANCYVETGRNEAAIREYRIALALSPDSDIGKFSQQALNDLLGKPKKSAPSSSPVPFYKQPTALEKQLSETFNALDKQTSASTNQKYTQSNSRADSYRKASDSVVERAKLEMLRSMLNSGRSPKLNRNHKKQLRDLKRMYQARARAQSSSNNRQVSAIQTSSENLKRLLRENHNLTGHRLKPQGTNLYIRNYGSN